jgi:hypothetical protein
MFNRDNDDNDAECRRKFSCNKMVSTEYICKNHGLGREAFAKARESIYM